MQCFSKLINRKMEETKEEAVEERGRRRRRRKKRKRMRGKVGIEGKVVIT